jgi:predicted amidohydrolase YtcJ
MAGWRSEQRLSFSEALHGFTFGAAYAAGLERKLGKLSPNYYADLIVLDENPFTCPPETLLMLKPVSVMIGGEWVWQAD